MLSEAAGCGPLTDGRTSRRRPGRAHPRPAPINGIESRASWRPTVGPGPQTGISDSAGTRKSVISIEIPKWQRDSEPSTVTGIRLTRPGNHLRVRGRWGRRRRLSRRRGGPGGEAAGSLPLSIRFEARRLPRATDATHTTTLKLPGPRGPGFKLARPPDLEPLAAPT